MTQAWHPGLIGERSRGRGAVADSQLRSSGWLVLTDPGSSIDLPRLFPEISVRTASSSPEFSEALADGEPALVVLVAPPAGPGDLQLAAAWLGSHPRACGVLLSPHHAVASRLHALELGLDDAIDLDSDPMEIVGRLSILGHRAASPPLGSGSRILLDEGVELDLRARAIRRDGRLEALRPREFELIQFLASHPGRAFSRGELMGRVWQGRGAQERMVDVYVFWLRSKIERSPSVPRRIVTVRGSGYRFDPPPPTAAGRER